MTFLDLPVPVLWTMGAVYTVLVISSVALGVMRRVRPERNLREVRQRVESWWIMASVFLLAVALHRAASIVFLALVSYLALKEYLSLVPTRRADRRVLLMAYLAVPLQYWWIADDWYGLSIVFVPVYAFLAIPSAMVLMGETRRFLFAAASLHWGLMTTVFSLSHAALLLTLPDAGNPPSGGAGLLLFLVVLTQSNDVAQFLWGKAVGRLRAAPTVGRGKTLGGFLGGVGTTMLLAYFLAPVLTPLVGQERWVAGAIVAVAGFLGDLSVSAVKRDLGVTDADAAPQGRGGVLDRVDSLVFTAPLFFHYIHYLHF